MPLVPVAPIEPVEPLLLVPIEPVEPVAPVLLPVPIEPVEPLVLPVPIEPVEPLMLPELVEPVELWLRFWSCGAPVALAEELPLLWSFMLPLCCVPVVELVADWPWLVLEVVDCA